MTDLADLHKLLFQHFKYRAFLEGQEGVIQAIVNGRDTLVIMPTGGGKSLCYQLPALAMEGITLVVSPLIALMKDQVESLLAKNIPATSINSSLASSVMNERIGRMARGEYRLVYVAPERFKSEHFMRTLAPLSIALFAVDEAHCISQWGHDFRPDYTRLKGVLKELGQPQVTALTATATPEVRDDIIAQLGLGQSGREAPAVFVSGFGRPNLTLKVTATTNKEEKLLHIENTIRELKTGLIYCSTRKNVESVAGHLRARVRCVAYHGGMKDQQRTLAQDEFMSGKCSVAVATNAFGMGVDRADVRFVVHHDIPGSVEAYYQEAGRAGRDGEPARCELLFNFADVRTQEFFIEGANPTHEVIGDVYYALLDLCANGPIEMPIADIAEHVDGTNNEMAVGSALLLLARAYVIRRDYRPGSRTYTTHLLAPVKRLDELKIDYKVLDEKRRRDFAKLHQMIEYADHNACRHGFLLRYFGDRNAAKRCGACDNCLRANKGKKPAAVAVKNAAGQTPRAGKDKEDKIANEKAVLLQKALSGVARMKGRFGLGRIAQMLIGTRSREIFDSALDKLSTYGLLHDFGYEFTADLLARLNAAGCIEITAEENARAILTPLGEDVMRAKVALDIELPEYEKLSASATQSAGESQIVDEAPYDKKLYEALRAWRRQTALRMNISAFVIYPDVTLKELSRRKPRNADALLEVRGIGPAKVTQFGAETLDVIRKFGGGD